MEGLLDTLVEIKHWFWCKKNSIGLSLIVSRCVTCHKAKKHGNNVGLYTPLPIPTTSWEDEYGFYCGIAKNSKR